MANRSVLEKGYRGLMFENLCFACREVLDSENWTPEQVIAINMAFTYLIKMESKMFRDWWDEAYAEITAMCPERKAEKDV